MLRVAIFSVLVAIVFADCGVLEAQLVKQQWAKAMGHGEDREDFFVSIFNDLFADMPDARALFDRVRGDNTYSPEFRAHASRVFGGVDLCVGALDQEPRFVATLAHLKGQHVERKIPAEAWAAFKGVILNTIPKSVGLCFARDAWSSCLDRIVGGIQ